jgi:hypothetical protein
MARVNPTNVLSKILVSYVCGDMSTAFLIGFSLLLVDFTIATIRYFTYAR